MNISLQVIARRGMDEEAHARTGSCMVDIEEEYRPQLPNDDYAGTVDATQIRTGGL